MVWLLTVTVTELLTDVLFVQEIVPDCVIMLFVQAFTQFVPSTFWPS